MRVGRIQPLIALTVGAAMALTACSGAAGPAGGPSGTTGGSRTLTVAAQLDNNSFDTALLEEGNRVQYWQPVYDTLLTLDTEAQPHPNMATSWSYNEDNTVLTLELRDDITFSDGTPLDVDAVRANIEHLRAGTGPNNFMVAAVTDVTAVDPHTAQIHLSDPVPSFVTYLGKAAGAMASPKASAAGTLENAPVGAGPYVLDTSRTQRGTRYVYTRNSSYFAPEKYPFDEVVVLPMIDLTPRLNGLKSGEVNAAFIDQKSAADAKASGLNVYTLPINWLGLLIMDRDGTIVPALGDVRVRQAINHAIDRQKMVDSLLLGMGEPTAQVFNPKSDAYVPELDDAYAYDPDAARALMAEAGYADGFAVTLPTQPGSVYASLDPIVDSQLAAIGITVTRKNVSPDQGFAALLSGQFPMLTMPLGSKSAWEDVQTLATPKAPWNPLHSTDPELEALVSTAQHATGEDQVKAFQDINRGLVDNAWFSPWLRPDNVFATTADVTTTMQAQNAVPYLQRFAPAK
jgi:peptide/nickel transport system substrate-binding protein